MHYFTSPIYSLSVLLLLTAIPALSAESTFSGLVVAVTDGDTVKVMHDGAPEIIRLNGIDCPEKKQAFGNKAKEYTALMCFQKQVTVNAHGHDRYKRTIGDINLPDGKNVNAELVKAGLAWWYKKYAPNNRELEQLEQNARSQRLGLWQDAAPIAPWDFRHQRKPAYSATIE